MTCLELHHQTTQSVSNRLLAAYWDESTPKFNPVLKSNFQVFIRSQRMHLSFGDDFFDTFRLPS
jgi:hypothetical protein